MGRDGSRGEEEAGQGVVISCHFVPSWSPGLFPMPICQSSFSTPSERGFQPVRPPTDNGDCRAVACPLFMAATFAYSRLHAATTVAIRRVPVGLVRQSTCNGSAGSACLMQARPRSISARSLAVLSPIVTAPVGTRLETPRAARRGAEQLDVLVVHDCVLLEKPAHEPGEPGCWVA